MSVNSNFLQGKEVVVMETQKQPLKMIMLSAMYENGGNTTHRFLDGHPELLVYPFESQLGTSMSNNFIQSLVPYRYCWPEFPIEGKVESDYELFYDEEMKALLRTPYRSKFKDAGLELDEKERKAYFIEEMKGKARNRANLVDAFFVSTFKAWKNVNKTGKEKAYVGYSPVIALDTEKILKDMPNAHIIHVVRNPYSGYSDTKKRPFPLTLDKYVWTWNIVQHMALTYAESYPKNVHIVRFEDIIENPRKNLSELCGKLDLSDSETLEYPSWNGARLDKVLPWGTIQIPTPEVNKATMDELSADEKAQIRITSSVMLKQFGYDHLY